MIQASDGVDWVLNGIRLVLFFLCFFVDIGVEHLGFSMARGQENGHGRGTGYHAECAAPEIIIRAGLDISY